MRCTVRRGRQKMALILSEATAPKGPRPVFAGVLAGLVQAPAQLLRAEYLTLLRGMDWQAEFSDDGNARRAAAMTLARLRELQPTVDPARELYRAACDGDRFVLIDGSGRTNFCEMVSLVFVVCLC
jgi:hypothetical protein